MMALLFGVSFACYLSLITYHQTLLRTYFSLTANWLVVQESFGGGEIHGSRLDNDVLTLLRQNGYRDPVPEIHQVVGTSLSNAVMIRGFRPEDLSRISPFQLVSGKVLTNADPSRSTMIGINLANRLKLNVGDLINLRGRSFSIIGIFKNGSYEDNQAWMSLDDAQKLINYGSDVSVYYIQDGGTFSEGMTISNGVSIGRRGDSGNTYGIETMSFYQYLKLVGIFVGIATVITLENLLWRLAWLHRHEFGIIRSLGFGKISVETYLFTQIIGIVLVGGAAGGLFANFVMIANIKNQSAFGISLSPVWDWHTIGLAGLITLSFSFVSIFIPAVLLRNKTTSELLGRN